ncbi:MAG TPA: hypothetical protein VLC08_06150 [Chitinolyticbacter sp.]|nr:hypothetical protein [Chitinolyticbacter sp.]
MADAFQTWLYRLVHSPEWAELQARFLEDRTRQAITGQWSEQKVAEFARDQKGVAAFSTWCLNETAVKAGQIDGRARRYEGRRTRGAEPKGNGTGAGQ